RAGSSSSKIRSRLINPFSGGRDSGRRLFITFSPVSTSRGTYLRSYGQGPLDWTNCRLDTFRLSRNPGHTAAGALRHNATIRVLQFHRKAEHAPTGKNVRSSFEVKRLRSSNESPILES